MKLEIHQGGVLKWTIESTDYNLSQHDIVTVITNATMSAKGFDELFFKYVNDSKTHVDAYERAEAVHITLLGHRKYSDYESFRINKSKRLKK